MKGRIPWLRPCRLRSNGTSIIASVRRLAIMPKAVAIGFSVAPMDRPEASHHFLSPRAPDQAVTGLHLATHAS